MKEIHNAHPERVPFDIEGGKKILIGKSVSEGLFSGNRVRYVIPAYQRSYLWGEDEIIRLLDDIAEGAKSEEPRFMGTIQVSSPRRLSNKTIGYELRDGQQRLSTLLILLFHLGIDYTASLRTAVNAGRAQRDWDDFKENFDMPEIERKFPANKYVHASAIIKSWLWLKAKNNDSNGMSPSELTSYIECNLYFVVIQTQVGEWAHETRR